MSHSLILCASSCVRYRSGVSLALVCCFLAWGCSLDPNVKKQKYLDRANQYFSQEKYAEAMISYRRALQVDPRFAEAHYGLARTHLKMGSLGPAYQELQRTVSLQPENWKAQVELGQLE